MPDLPIKLLHIIWVLPLTLLVLYIGSPRFRGTSGQARTRRILSAILQKNQYTVFNALTIPGGGGTVRIDHLIISQFGIFVIKTVHRPGKITGAEFQDRWKQYRFGRFTRFDNPLHQNQLVIDALELLLHLPRYAFHSIVVISGSDSIHKNMPPNVISTPRLISHIRKHNRKLLQPEDANRVALQVEQARLGSRRTFWPDRWSLLRFSLFSLLLACCWLAFHPQLESLYKHLREHLERKPSAQLFHADGSPKSEQEVWESTLNCAYSADTGRCACYQPDGLRVDPGPEKCRSLSERGQVLD